MTGLHAITNKEAHPNDWITLLWSDSSFTSGIERCARVASVLDCTEVVKNKK
jgi:hypothetical protein